MTQQPPLTQAHRQAAFQLLAIRGCTFEQAMHNPIKRKLIDACATGIRNKELACRAHATSATATDTGTGGKT